MRFKPEQRSSPPRGWRAALACAGVLALCASSVSGEMVRVGYVVPQNRSAQPTGVGNLQNLVTSISDWYAEQMDRYGFGPKTFQYESVRGGLPRVHQVTTPSTDETLRADIWSNTISAASGAGLSIWTPGEVWLLASEAHQQQPNGSITGGTALGASFGSDDDPGVAMIGGDSLPRVNPAALSDTRRYGGLVIPELGPRPLVEGVSFPSFSGNTVSSISSSAQGAAAHELGHAFGLAHDFRNDRNFHGNLMGNGLRGWRGSHLPELFPEDDVRLSYAAALALNVSRYFNPNTTYTDNVKPSVAISTSGAVNPVNGLLDIHFTASDAGGLAAALLRRNGETIGEMPLSGESVNTTFSTPFYTPTVADEYTVAIYDQQGNMRSFDVDITPNAGFNRAPEPFVRISRSTLRAGDEIQLDASRSNDADHPARVVTVEWDLDGDGLFDTAPTFDKMLLARFDEPGVRLIRARLTDPSGAASISTPLALRVLPDVTVPGDTNQDGIVDLADLNNVRNNFGGQGPVVLGDTNGDGLVDLADLNNVRNNFGAVSPSAPVPEPSAVVLALLGLCGAAFMRRR